jgi:hypothetical protein
LAQSIIPTRASRSGILPIGFDASCVWQLVNTLPTVDLENVQGVELYYNAEITPWFHLTGDLQIIDNENVGDDTAIILGLRAKMDL